MPGLKMRMSKQWYQHQIATGGKDLRPFTKANPHGPSKLEAAFDLIWKSLNGPELVKEHRFHKERRWRFDRAHIFSAVAIEIEGGVWTNGRHTRGSGYIADCQKYNEAQLLGWRVFRITQPNVPEIQRIIDLINNTKTT